MTGGSDVFHYVFHYVFHQKLGGENEKAEALGYNRRADEMREVWRTRGFVFHIYANDHEPSHVRVYKSGKSVVINLGDEESRPEIRESRMGRVEAKRALMLAAKAQDNLLSKWNEIHGQGKGREMGVHGRRAKRSIRGSEKTP